VISVPSRTEILEDIVAILSEQTGVSFSGSVSEETRLFADLGLASIDAVVLTEALQKHYERTLPFHELIAEVGRRTERDLAIGELVEFLATHL
jgi:acyl carrier protein